MITYLKGPLGYAIVKDGKVIGKIKNIAPRGWMVKLQGQTFAPEPGSVAAYFKRSEVDGKICKTLAGAKKLVKSIIQE